MMMTVMMIIKLKTMMMLSKPIIIIRVTEMITSKITEY